MVYFCFILWWLKKAFNDHYVLICKTIIWLTTVIPCDICPKTDQFKIIINRELTGSDIFVSSVCRENGWNLHFSFYLSSMSIYQVFFGRFTWKVSSISHLKVHSVNLELRFCKNSNPACGVSEIYDSENLGQWSWLKIRINALLMASSKQRVNIINSFLIEAKQYNSKTKQCKQYIQRVWNIVKRKMILSNV